MQPRDTEKWRSLGNEAYNKSVPATSCGQIKGNTDKYGYKYKVYPKPIYIII